MTNPKWATRGKTGERVYRFPDDATDYPSVTTLIGQLDKPALMYWAAKSVAEGAVAQRDVWGEMPPEDAIRYLKGLPFSDRDRKANYGTLIHDLIETGTESNLPRIGVAKQVIYDLFGEHYGSELTVVNTRSQYAGSADVHTYTPDGRFAVADWKTGKTGFLSQAAQIAALALCTHIVTEDAEWVPLPEQPTVGYVIGLQDDGYTAFELNLDEVQQQRWQKFMTALREIYELRVWWGRDGQWTEEYGRRVRG